MQKVKINAFVCFQQTCITSESCTFYTFSFDSSRCLLFSNCPMIVDSDDANSATSEVDCAVPREGEFLFVAGGWDIWGSSSRVELIMLDDLGAVRTPPPCLQSLERLPEASNSGSGASLIGSGDFKLRAYCRQLPLIISSYRWPASRMRWIPRRIPDPLLPPLPPGKRFLDGVRQDGPGQGVWRPDASS